MIEINQIDALGAEPLLDLALDPRRAVPHRVHARIHPEARPDRAVEQAPARDLHAAFDPSAVDRRPTSLGVRERDLRLSPRQLLSLPLVLLVRVRLHDRDHAAVDLGDDLLVPARLFRKILRSGFGFEDGPPMAQSDSLDRALADLEAVMFAQFPRDMGEGVVRGEIHDRPLQRPGTPARIDFRAENKRAHPMGFEPILRLENYDLAELRMPLE